MKNPDDFGMEEDEPQSAVDSAFANETHSLGEIKLEPYTPMRVIAAQAMQLHFGFVDEAGLAQFDRTGVYPGLPRDMAIVLWLCTVTDRHALDRAARQPVLGVEKAVEWAHGLGIDNPATGNEIFWEARNVFLSIMTAISDSGTVPTGEEVEAPKKKAVKPKKH